MYFYVNLKFSLNSSLGHLFNDMCVVTKGDQVTNSKTYVKVHCYAAIIKL